MAPINVCPSKIYLEDAISLVYRRMHEICQHVPGDAGDVLHSHVDDQLSVNRLEKRFSVQWDIVEVIKEIIVSEVVKNWWKWIICTCVVHQPGGSVEWIDRVGISTFVDEEHVGILEIKNGVVLVRAVFGSHEE